MCMQDGGGEAEEFVRHSEVHRHSTVPRRSLGHRLIHGSWAKPYQPPPRLPRARFECSKSGHVDQRNVSHGPRQHVMVPVDR